MRLAAVGPARESALPFCSQYIDDILRRAPLAQDFGWRLISLSGIAQHGSGQCHELLGFMAG
jgi:hypothetical protein